VYQVESEGADKDITLFKHRFDEHPDMDPVQVPCSSIALMSILTWTLFKYPIQVPCSSIALMSILTWTLFKYPVQVSL